MKWLIVDWEYEHVLPLVSITCDSLWIMVFGLLFTSKWVLSGIPRGILLLETHNPSPKKGHNACHLKRDLLFIILKGTYCLSYQKVPIVYHKKGIYCPSLQKVSIVYHTKGINCLSYQKVSIVYHTKRDLLSIIPKRYLLSDISKVTYDLLCQKGRSVMLLFQSTVLS